ncbi:MAG TPA: terminase small subunit [Pyrinomonadaceae bacterium]|nr:terminase small subunit [Pyrinomonadaceae bacterium]
MSEETQAIKLTGKQKAFVDAYLTTAHFNATQAARDAGYKGKDASLSQIGYENLRKLEIKQAVDEGLSAMSMSANEVIARLNSIARGKVTDVLNDAGYFDLQLAKTNHKDGLIKKLKTKRTLKQKKTEITDSMRGFLAEDEVEDIETETEIIYEETEFELYSAHEALRDLGKYHKLFTDKTELSGTVQTVGMTIDEFRKQAAERLKEANKTLGKFDE